MIFYSFGVIFLNLIRLNWRNLRRYLEISDSFIISEYLSKIINNINFRQSFPLFDDLLMMMNISTIII